jgi:hypothetical protein
MNAAFFNYRVHNFRLYLRIVDFALILLLLFLTQLRVMIRKAIKNGREIHGVNSLRDSLH